MTKVSDITSALEQWAPLGTQQSYDNARLQVGDPDSPVTHALIALDLTPAVIDEAIDAGAQLIITHHPVIFRPIKSVTTGTWQGALILRLAQAGIALYCIHTNLDAAKDGVSFALARQLGLTNIKFLKPLNDALVKLVTFVPNTHLDTVRNALAEAGAGRIGEYDACAFISTGTGYFKPGVNTNPHIGEADGGLTSANEMRIEVEVQRWQLGSILRALHASHPYEEVAYDIYALEKAATQVGMGAIGELENAQSLEDFLQHISEALDTDGLRFVGDPDKPVKRVAVCGGSGADLMGDAQRAGADAYVTADVTYHRYFDVLNTEGTPEMALIDAIHYETEACTENLLQEWLADRFSDVVWQKTVTRTSPIRTFMKK